MNRGRHRPPLRAPLPPHGRRRTATVATVTHRHPVAPPGTCRAVTTATPRGPRGGRQWQPAVFPAAHPARIWPVGAPPLRWTVRRASSTAATTISYPIAAAVTAPFVIATAMQTMRVDAVGRRGAPVVDSGCASKELDRGCRFARGLRRGGETGAHGHSAMQVALLVTPLLVRQRRGCGGEARLRRGSRHRSGAEAAHSLLQGCERIK